MAKIKKIEAREILSARGVPTIETQIILDTNISITSSVSATDAGGISEKVELRDQDSNRYEGMGVTKAVSYINSLIAPKLIGADVNSQENIDNWLLMADKSENKHILGVNTIMSVSQAVAKVSAAASGLPLFAYLNALFKKKLPSAVEKIEKMPAPIFTLINGGRHAPSDLSFQEFSIVPSTSLGYEHSLQLSVGLYNSVAEILRNRNIRPVLSPEGGFAPDMSSNIAVFDILVEAAAFRKLHLGTDVSLSIDLASSNYYGGARYKLSDRPSPLKPEEYMDFLQEINKQYNILIMEDPLEKNDLPRWSKLMEKYGSNTYIIGDDFISGNKARLNKALSSSACNGILIKYGQLSTITEMLDFAALAKSNGLKLVIGHRLNDSDEYFLADFATAVMADFVKFGPPVGWEHVSKYNRLLKIAQLIAAK